MSPAKPICLWLRCDASGDYRNLEFTLTAKQASRHRTFESLNRANEYLLGRWLCNQLSPYASEDDRNGLPYLPDLPDVSLNITHSRNQSDLFIAAAIGKGLIGLDGENLSKRRKIDRLSEQWFTEDELLWMSADREARNQRFFALWTAKEALIKSHRGSIAQHLKQTKVTINEQNEMSSGNMAVSHYRLEADLLLAIAHADSASPTAPIRGSIPINC